MEPGHAVPYDVTPGGVINTADTGIRLMLLVWCHWWLCSSCGRCRNLDCAGVYVTAGFVPDRAGAGAWLTHVPVMSQVADEVIAQAWEPGFCKCL